MPNIVNDLVDLDELALTDACVLHTLRMRYHGQDAIYTAIGESRLPSVNGASYGDDSLVGTSPSHVYLIVQPGPRPGAGEGRGPAPGSASEMSVSSAMTPPSGVIPGVTNSSQCGCHWDDGTNYCSPIKNALNETLVWVDYASIPQACPKTLTLAVRSLSAIASASLA